MPRAVSIVAVASWFIMVPFFGLGLRYTIQKREFYILEGKSLVGNVTAVKKVADRLHCSFLCLEYGPLACLSFNFEKSNNDGFHSCQLSNSEKHFEPHKVQDMPTYDYYGTTLKSLYSIRPCASSPCSYGGTCSEGPNLGEFFCHCKPAPTVLPYIDNLCNVDQSGVLISSAVKGVFHGRAVSRYKLNFNNAKRFCELLGAKLATYNQLHAAWQAGLQKCFYGWLADGKVLYPMQVAKPGCGNRGIRGYFSAMNKAFTYDTWCYK